MRQAFILQNAYRSITRNGQRKGMVVNEEKTNLICISDALNYTPLTFFLDYQILGFDFSTRPTVDALVDSIWKRLGQRYLVLRHLKKHGMTEEKLVRIYKSILLPVADYCDFVYHSVLTDEQDHMLETAQNGALRVIFGGGISARNMRQMVVVETLRSQKIEHTNKFAKKASQNPRFRHWFPQKKH